MKCATISFDPLSGRNFSEAAHACADILGNKGAVALVPTETVYGLVCGWNDARGRERIVEMKGRSPEKHFQMLALDLSQAEAFGYIVDGKVRKVAERFFPGPLTLVHFASGGQGTIGLRIPSHDFTREVLKLVGIPLAATSANVSGSAQAGRPGDIAGKLASEPDIIVDAGNVSGTASTVADMTGERPVVLREGPVTLRMLEEVLRDRQARSF